jgi:CheY-like chemotaxis protein
VLRLLIDRGFRECTMRRLNVGNPNREEDARQRLKIEEALVKAGHRVIGASGGNEAVTRLKETRYDLLLTDLMMEQGAGFDVLEWVRENAPGLPVIICSSYAKGDN